VNLLLERGNSVLLSIFEPNQVAPYSNDLLKGLPVGSVLQWKRGVVDSEALARRLHAFEPDVALISGWNHRAYRQAARMLSRTRAVRVLCMDNPWEETPKQILGRVVAPVYISPYFDVAFVGGERQAQFARRLGFADSEIHQGVFAADPKVFFSEVSFAERQVGFVFLGRLSPEKGIRELMLAYQSYRDSSPDPWPLTVAGVGPQDWYVTEAEGVRELGFVQPDALNKLLNANQCLVAPSLREPWGVQIHEATSAALPVICSSACGSAVHLVRDGFNGLIVPPGDVPSLARAFHQVESNRRLGDWSTASASLAKQFSPTLWVRTLENMRELASPAS